MVSDNKDLGDVLIESETYLILGTIHDIFYMGLVLQMITGVAQVSTSLKMIDIFGSSSMMVGSEKKHKKRLLGMWILSALFLVTLIIVAVLSFLKGTGLKYKVKLIIDVCFCPILMLTYIWWLHTVFKLMKNLQNLSLQLHSEHMKLKYQTFYYTVSLLAFLASHIVILLGTIDSLYSTILM